MRILVVMLGLSVMKCNVINLNRSIPVNFNLNQLKFGKFIKIAFVIFWCHINKD